MYLENDENEVKKSKVKYESKCSEVKYEPIRIGFMAGSLF